MKKIYSFLPLAVFVVLVFFLQNHYVSVATGALIGSLGMYLYKGKLSASEVHGIGRTVLVFGGLLMYVFSEHTSDNAFYYLTIPCLYFWGYEIISRLSKRLERR